MSSVRTMALSAASALALVAGCANGTAGDDDGTPAPGSGASQSSSGIDSGSSGDPFNPPSPSNSGDGGAASPPGSTCNPGQTSCGGACIDTATDPNNCGSCGKSCHGAACSNGSCSVGTGSTCPVIGSCAHSVCHKGAPLDDGCDVDQCTSFVCEEIDPYCCGVKWDGTCVDEAIFYCGESCGAGC